MGSNAREVEEVRGSSEIRIGPYGTVHQQTHCLLFCVFFLQPNAATRLQMQARASLLGAMKQLRHVGLTGRLTACAWLEANPVCAVGSALAMHCDAGQAAICAAKSLPYFRLPAS